MREPDALDAARVLALSLLLIAAANILKAFGAPPFIPVVVQQLAFFAVPLVYCRAAGLRPFAANGYVPLPLRRLALVLVASLGTFWLLNGLTHVQTELFRRTGYEATAKEEEQKIAEGIERAQQEGAAPALAMLVVLPPLCEETFFRGIVFRGMIARFGPAIPLALTTLLFAYMHPTRVQFGLMLFLGCYFGLLVHLTGSLWASIAAHALNNFVVVLLMWIYKNKLPDFVAPWWMYALSALVFGLAMARLALDRKPVRA